MATFTQRKEPLVTCPYNPAHQVKSGRFQIHITKCRKAYPEKDMKQCPFSAEHVVPASQIMHHIYTCPLNTTVERFLTADQKDVPSGNLLLPERDLNREIPSEENWDAEVAAGGARSTLEDKIPVPAVQPVFADVQAMAPAERRSFYARLHTQAQERERREKEQQAKQQQQEEDEVPQGPPTLSVPRQPTTMPKVLPYEHAAKFIPQLAAKPAEDDDSDDSSEEDEDEELEQAMRARCQGLGRGFVGAHRPAGTSVVNGGESAEARDLNDRMKLLGLGRGRRVLPK